MNENHDEPNGEAAENVTPDGEPKAARRRFEDERMTRRQALRKIGLTMGMATFAMLSVDDLARFSAKKLQENEVSKGIGDTLAQEFRSAGVAFADPYYPSGPYYPPNPSGPPPNPSGPPPNPSGPPPNPSGPAPCTTDVCISCGPDNFGEVDCQQCSVALAAASSPENILAMMGEAGIPGDITIVDSAILACQADAEDACNAASNPDGNAIIDAYAKCIASQLASDLFWGLLYSALKKSLVGADPLWGTG